jgi:formylglycine-generating enzyme required for sulfatase activity
VAANKAQPASARVKKMWGLWGVPAWIGLLTFLVIAVFLLDHYFPRLGEQLANTEAKPAVEACVPGKEREDAGITYVRICPGTFTMGSSEEEAGINGNELPAHQVTLREFWIGKTEITNEQYRQFSFDHPGEANLPAADISWSDAAAACQYFGGRLPTEAEWEYAARAGSQTAWSFGNDEKMLPEYAWYSENSGFTAHPVGKKKPNAWGLHDVHGNVMEWVAGWFDVYSAEAQINPVGPSKGMLRVLRGGSFYSSPDRLRSAIRGTNSPKDRVKVFGFRCAHDPSFQTPSK